MNAFQKNMLNYGKPLFFLMVAMSVFTAIGYATGAQYSEPFILVLCVFLVAVMVYVPIWIWKAKMLHAGEKKQ